MCYFTRNIIILNVIELNEDSIEDVSVSAYVVFFLIILLESSIKDFILCMCTDKEFKVTISMEGEETSYLDTRQLLQ